jgi:hypothetical protein
VAAAGSMREIVLSASRYRYFCSLSHAMLPELALSGRSILVSRVRRFVDQRLSPRSKRAR